MSQRSFLPPHRLAPLLLGSLLLTQASAFAQPAPGKDPEGAKKLFREAEDARLAKNYELCVQKSEQALAAFPQVQILGQLGLCQYELGKYPEAAQHLAAYIAQTNTSVDPAFRSAFDKSKTRVAEVSVTCNAPGAAISIDGKPVGAAPTTTFVAPGTHAFDAKKEGYVPATESRELLAGVKLEVSIILKLDESASTGGAGGGGGAPPTSGATTSGSGSYGGDGGTSRPVWPAAVGLGLAGAGLVLGGVFTGLSFSKASDVDAAREEVGSTCNAGDPSTRCREAFEARDDQVFFANGAVTSFIAAGAVAGASIGYLVWALSGDDEEPSGTAIRMTPIVGPDAQGLIFQGSF